MDHSEMLNIYQGSFRNLHILQIAKVHDNEQMDSHTIRRENLLFLIKEIGSKAELGRRADVSIAYLSQVTSEKTQRNIGSAVARRIEKAAHKKRGWLDVLHPELRAGKEMSTTPLVWIPIISWAEAGGATRPRDGTMKIPTTAEVAGRLLSEKCFALRVTGDAMVNPLGRPSYPPGCVIIVDPERVPKNADRVLVKIADVDEPAFKVYTIDSGRIFLRSLNPQYPPLAWRDDMRILGVVVQTVIDE